MNNYLPTDYQSFIATSRYARWLNDENRRENWRETVERFIANVVKGKADVRTEDDILFAMLNLEVMPSMRSVMTAGPALHVTTLQVITVATYLWMTLSPLMRLCSSCYVVQV
jgi:hypothetical protein